jgi:predicted RNA binding protein YcfA (HicA-like mRNA interferase family)
MKRSELEKRLRDAGCVLSRHGSRHDKWENPKTSKFEWVPRHSKEVATGTALAILKNLDAWERKGWGTSPATSSSSHNRDELFL